MPKTVSATEAKNRLGNLIGWVLRNRDEVIVESRGEPKVVLIPYAEYEQMRDLKEQARKHEVLARLRDLRDKVRSRNQDLSEEEGDVIADRFSNEIIEDIAKDGKIQFEK